MSTPHGGTIKIRYLLMLYAIGLKYRNKELALIS